MSTHLSVGQPAPRRRILVACASCDTLQTADIASPAETLHCVRCDVVVYRAMHRAPDAALALTVAATICFLMGNALPIVAIEAGGNAANTTLIGAAQALDAADMRSVAVVVLLTTVVAPALELSCLLALLSDACWGGLSRLRGALVRARERLRPLSMVEIFVLGALVAIVKLGDLAKIVLGLGLWSLFGFMVLSATAAFAIERTDLWTRARTA